MALLEVIDVRKTYDADTHAVRDVSLSLERGEILCLLGPSGCGKTTLLRMIAGLEQPDTGVIRFDGRDMTGVRPHERGFGMMFQDFALFPHKNVRDNVAFGLRMQGLAPKEINERVSRVLDLVELDDLAEREIAQLSGGEQQRVALARSLAPGPQLLMLDEPLGALDRALRERLMLDLRAILKRVGMTAVYVTHDQTEAFAVADRLAVMNAGQIEQIGPPQAVHEYPATPFVAQFLGFQNLVPGQVTKEGLIKTAVGHFKLPGLSLDLEQSVTLLIKPIMAGVEIDVDAGRTPINSVDGVVDAVTFRGRFSQVWITANGQRLLFEEAGNLPFGVGDTVRIAVSPDQLLIYESSR
jgi:ABC-type Fe3+/spermidine/putrescine transport system ATPase subunit